MEHLEDLANLQENTALKIKKMYSNYKKDSSGRKTSSYLDTRRELLEELWGEFQQRHHQMLEPLENNEEGKDHPYFAKDFFSQTKALYIEVKNALSDATKPEAAARAREGQAPDQPGTSGNHQPATQETTTTDPQREGSQPVDRQQQRIRVLSTTMSSLERILTTVSDVSSQAHSRFYFEHIIRTIKEYWTEISQLHREIMAYSSRNGYDDAHYYALEDKYHEAMINLQERLYSGTPSQIVPVNQQRVKLPEITLPTFDGNPSKWVQFQDLFTQLIHNQIISTTQKFYYLKANLSGEPSQLIRHLQVSGDNYDVAWNILNERYDNKRAIVTALLNELLTQPPIPAENGSSLKRLHDTSKECIMALTNIQADIVKSDVVLLHILLQKLDKESRRLYEQGLKDPRGLQSLDEFFKFLEGRFRMLESIQQKPKEFKAKPISMVAADSTASCSVCRSGAHKIYNCSKFLKLSVEGRWRLVRQLQLCTNCLRPNHSADQCQSSHCSHCSVKHNSLLHQQHPDAQKKTISGPFKAKRHSTTNRQAASARQGERITNAQDLQVPTATQPQPGPSSSRASMNASSSSQILLATAIVHVYNSQGTLVPCRALLDSGSQLHFITERLAHEIGNQRIRINLPITGIGGISTTAKTKMMIRLKSRINLFSSAIEAVVLPRINVVQPQNYINTSNWNMPEGIELADPTFATPQEIDLLIGAELYTTLLQTGQITISKDLPVLQNSHLGWIVTGKVVHRCLENQESNLVSNIASHSLAGLERQVQRFWEVEQHDTPTVRLTAEEKNCEDFFAQTFKRAPNGRFIVRLPFREEPKKLGSSMEIAFKRFYALEKRLSKDPDLKKQYAEFMNEYESLGHMEKFPLHDISNPHYFIPHHPVLKPESSSTKLRVVFDASAKTTSGVSLNNLLMVGPTIQPDLFSILVKFRLHEYVFTTDIKKMYRQIEVQTGDQHFQLILWRSDPGEPVQAYRLKTVTYGTTSAPFLATRCIKQLAQDDHKLYERASEVLQGDTYVDDILTGTDSIAEAQELKRNLIALLNRGKFELSKFCANHPDILSDIPEEKREKMLQINDSAVIKALGLIWQPQEDVFQFTASPADLSQITKRTILADVARLFDPLGLVGPVVVLGKLFVQEMWKLQLPWDSPPPEDLRQKWARYKEQLEDLKSLRTPRWVLCSNPENIQLHAFSDSSNVAYGSCCYMRTVDKFGQIKTRLLCSKSRLAPLRSTTTARLELCASVLMVELVERLLQVIPTKIDQIFYHTDSTTVLSWISAPSYSWGTFVANRVAKIQDLTQAKQWRHIDGTANPADIISRGMLPKCLKQSKVWFEGPAFLSEKENQWPESKFKPPENIPEARASKSVLTVVTTSTAIVDLTAQINHQNSWERLKRVVAYCLRWQRNSKLLAKFRTSGKPTATELDVAEKAILRNVQQTAFSKEYQKLAKGLPLDNSNHMQSLSPYFNTSDKLIRVGGRLKMSSLDPDAKSQVLLPKDHVVSRLILAQIHAKNMHAAPQALIATARQRYWILDVRQLARSIVRNCIRCFRCKPQAITQYMGDLPRERVRPSRPFHITGVDFCGPFTIYHRLRGKTATKAYVAIFVCFATKAVHTELVSDLTSEAFLNSLKRFIARRGLCHTIFCDNATNFVGAKSALKELHTLVNSTDFTAAVTELCSKNHVIWKFIPPRSPHFGGLWEAAVKSAKYHLVRQVGSAHLTYEELHTVVVQIEAILNSRPLTAMSSDPNDLEALTPGHFLTGGPLNSLPEPDISQENIDHLTRYRRLQHIQQSFWNRWSSEYIQQLQPRAKWRNTQPNITPGTLVLIKDQNLPPLKWPLGRVTEAFKGSDGLSRVVVVKTATGMFKRAIHNVCPLPPIVNGEENPPVTDQHTSNREDKDVPAKNTRRRKFLPIGPQWGLNHDTARAPDAKKLKPANSLRPTSTAKVNVSAALALTLLANLVLPIMCTPIEIKSFSSYPGVYYENMGQLELVNDDWNLIVYYDMTHYWKEFTSLNRSVLELKEMCYYLGHFRSYCLSTTNELQHELEALHHNNFILKSNWDSPTRKRRAPFEAIGTISNKLFGLLDADYARKLEETIEHVSTNEHHLSQLIKEQTSVLNATLNIIKKDEAHVNSQFKVVLTYINQILTDFKDAKKQISEQQLVEVFNSLSINTNIILSSYRRTQAALIDLITDTHSGKINPLLLTPAQLHRQLTIMREHMPLNVRLPVIKDENNILQFYQLISARGRITEDKAIFEVKLPLVDKESYKLYQIIPLPIFSQQKYHFIELSTTFMSVNLHQDKFLSISETEVARCRTSTEGVFLCKHPAHNKCADSQLCERQLFSNQERELPKTCNLRATSPIHWFRQLHTTNQWLYCVTNKTQISTVCGSTTSQNQIEGEGLITFNAECSAKVEGFIINTRKKNSNLMNASFVPAVHISQAHIKANYDVQTQWAATLTNLNHSSQIAQLQHSLAMIKNNTDLPQKIDHHEIHQYAIAYLSILGVVLLAIWAKRAIPSTWRPTPAPRNDDTRPRFELQEV